jgi:acyl-CoA thioester hydrolase
MTEAAPPAIFVTRVAPDWVDYNGHMNDAAYARVFSLSCDALMDRVGLDAASREKSGRTLYTLQMMLHYFKETKEGRALEVSCRVLEHDEKRLRVWFEMRERGESAPIAASEQLLLSVSQINGPRAAPWLDETKAALERMQGEQSERPWPPQAGHGIRLKKSAG